MPSGYTCAIADGSITELRPFIMRCARAFGALIDMRDSPLDAPIPEKLEGSNYHADQLYELKGAFKLISNMSETGCAAAAKLAAMEWDDNHAKRSKEYADQRQRYLDMIEAVEAWTGGPSEVKDFALQQLRESLRFDCPDETYRMYSDRPTEDASTWHAERLAALSRDIAYHEVGMAKDDARVAERQEWLDQLRASLPE